MLPLMQICQKCMFRYWLHYVMYQYYNFKVLLWSTMNFLASSLDANIIATSFLPYIVPDKVITNHCSNLYKWIIHIIPTCLKSISKQLQKWHNTVVYFQMSESFEYLITIDWHYKATIWSCCCWNLSNRSISVTKWVHFLSLKGWDGYDPPNIDVVHHSFDRSHQISFSNLSKSNI